MNALKFQNKYRIPSADFSCYDYNGGVNSVTICKKENGEMCLPQIGHFADNNPKRIAQNIENNVTLRYSDCFNT